MMRVAGLLVLGLLLAALPVVGASRLHATASSAAAREPNAPLAYRAEIRLFSRGVNNGEAQVGGESRTTIWRRGLESRSETTQWDAPGMAKNLRGAPIITGTTVRGADEFSIASSITNVPDADLLGYRLAPQMVTVFPASAYPTAIGPLGVGGVVRDPDDANALLGALGACYEAPRLVARGTVAQQPVNVFELHAHAGCVSTPIPDVPGTAARRLSVDVNTGLILKDEAFDAAGMSIPYTAFEVLSIDYHAALPDSLFEFEQAHGAIVRRCPDLQCGATSFPQEQSLEGLPDYTVVTLHTAIEDDRTNYFAQVTLGGATRDLPLSHDCYEQMHRARLDALPDTLSTVLPRECRSS